LNSQKPVSPLDKFLRLFTDVRGGEGVGALLLGLNIFLVLTAYYFIKPIREALIIGESGAEVKSYASAIQAMMLLLAVPLYSRLSERLPRRKLIDRVTLFFVACLVVFYLLGTAGVPLGVPFFLWVGVFNLMVVAQFWAFANDVYTNDEGERLFPLVQFGASLGAVLGSVAVGRLIEPLGIYLPMLAAAGLLVLSLFVTRIVDRRERLRTEANRPLEASTLTNPAATGEFRLATGEFQNLREALRQAIEQADAAEQAGDAPPELPQVDYETSVPAPAAAGGGVFSMVFRTRYLLLIALFVLMINWVNTTGEYLLGSVVEDAARRAIESGQTQLSMGEFIGSFYSDFFSVVNVLGLVLQLFVVSRIIKHVGIRIAVLVLPIIVIGGYALLAFIPILSAVRWAKTAENGFDYSLQNTVRNILFLPLTREQKYKAKLVIDAFFWRAGDMLSAGLVFAGTTWLSMGTAHFAMVNIVLGMVMLTLAWFIGAMYRDLVKSGRPPVTMRRIR
jgi:AAA family ATP:ADP antiporter